MTVDVSAILYSAINEIGRDTIRAGVSKDIATSQAYCQQILDKCRTILGDKTYGQVAGSLCEGLLHFMLTASVLPSQRKLSIHDTVIDIVIPSMRVLAKEPEKSVIIQIIKNEAEISKVAGAERLQPVPENLWVVASRKLGDNHRHYSCDGDNSFAKIIKDISDFVARKGVSGLKLFHGE
jgi:hypothetical protein